MVQVAPNVRIEFEADGSRVLADHFQRVVDQEAAAGWDFYRTDPFYVVESPGCLGALFGGKDVSRMHYVATFRRPTKPPAMRPG